MAFLFRARVAAVVTVRDALGLTDGNLAGHLQKLEAQGYVKTGRVLRGVRFEVQATITPKGSDALLDYVGSLRILLDQIDRP
jgi:DNA-binding MarR family transcriptional regulator